MLTSGDVVLLDLGFPQGSEAGLRRPAVVVTADRVLRATPQVVQVIPLTRTRRGYESEVTVEADVQNGLDGPSVAQSQHIRGVATTTIHDHLGNVGRVTLAQIRDALGALLDM